MLFSQTCDSPPMEAKMIYKLERIRVVFLCVVSLACLGVFDGIAAAQFDSATLTGIVMDPTGSVVPAVIVKAVNEATNIETSGVTDSVGRFTFSNLRPGTYTIKAGAPGFKQFVSTGFELQVNQAARFDITLTVGQVNDEVTIVAETPVLETQSGGHGAVIDSTKIIELPLNGRDYNQLA